MQRSTSSKVAVDRRVRLYERALPDGSPLDALWHVEAGRTYFAGPLLYNASHQHGAPVFLAGLYGDFQLRVEQGAWVSCRTAMIPAGVRHELLLHGNPLSVFYIEPGTAGQEAFLPLVRDAAEVHGALAGRSGEFAVLRQLYESRSATRWAAEALDDLVGYGLRRARRAIDPRIAAAVNRLTDARPGAVPVGQMAGEAGLSSSHFQRLFSREVGVPFRRYRAWQRMRAAIAEIVRGHSFTRSAHQAGFADQAHFAHDFRRTFGAPASVSLTKIRG
jgi:AraC-like DNA-binding protein